MTYQYDVSTLCLQENANPPLDAGRNSNLHKTFRRRPGCFLEILCTFSLRPLHLRKIVTFSSIVCNTDKISAGCIMFIECFFVHRR